METLIQGLPNIRIREQIRFDDTIDQLHHFVTVYLLVFLAIIVGIKEFAGAPLDCWYVNPNWKHYQDHANAYCWTHKLYKYPNEHNLSQVPYQLAPHGGPSNLTALQNNEDLGEINFYRWITIVFIFQAFLFKLPNLVWTECNEYSGTQIEKMVTLIGDSSFEGKDRKASVFSSVAEFMERWLVINRKPFWFMKSRVGMQTKKILQHCMLCVGANTGNYLSSMYLVVKFCFLFNVLMQFVILTAFLDFNYWEYGPKAVQYYQDSGTKIDSGHFPRVALCHFQVRGEGQWIQCLLTINMLLEKLFLIEWFWLLSLLLITLYSFVTWLMRILRTEQSVKFVTKYLSVFSEDGNVPQEGSRTVPKFVVDYLGNDGVFLLRILAYNTNDVAMSELMSRIWLRYCDYRNTAKRPSESQKTPEPSVDIQLEELELSEKGKNASRDETKGAGDSSGNPLIIDDKHHIA
ncbi:innexin unc-9 isoform X2 [Aplysia californica]|uniref:Innexin n=1 Tax=Aplysia californica TaxID=6500 RepID=A0ABM0JSQ6_APLCA|nr:innexin unc-9 isoform X2 [Aplysia californica]XP_035826211.1 innexin unc-9 isoform X2 [Aplysia californica]WEY19501.1 innexin 11b [Aplysia californica]